MGRVRVQTTRWRVGSWPGPAPPPPRLCPYTSATHVHFLDGFGRRQIRPRLPAPWQARHRARPGRRGRIKGVRHPRPALVRGASEPDDLPLADRPGGPLPLANALGTLWQRPGGPSTGRSADRAGKTTFPAQSRPSGDLGRQAASSPYLPIELSRLMSRNLETWRSIRGTWNFWFSYSQSALRPSTFTFAPHQ